MALNEWLLTAAALHHTKALHCFNQWLARVLLYWVGGGVKADGNVFVWPDYSLHRCFRGHHCTRGKRLPRANMGTPACDHRRALQLWRNPTAFISECTTQAHLRQIQNIRLNKLQHEASSLEILSFSKETQVRKDVSEVRSWWIVLFMFLLQSTTCIQRFFMIYTDTSSNVRIWLCIEYLGIS